MPMWRLKVARDQPSCLRKAINSCGVMLLHVDRAALIATGSVLLELASLLKHDLDKERAGGGDPLGKAVVERLHIRDFRPGHPHRARQPHPVEIGMAEIEHVERFAEGIATP